MSKRTYEELRDMLRHELDVLTKKGEITKDNLDHFNKITNTLWKVEELMKAEEGGSSYNSSYNQSMNGQSMNQSNNGQSMYYARMQRGNSNEGSYNQGSYDTGMSNRDSYADGSYARQGRDGDGDGRYSENRGDYSRRYDSYRGYSRDGYSRHTAKERMIEKLESMADKAMSEKDRRAIMDCIDELDK